MKLTDYYKMAKLPGSRSKSRFDCVASTGSYDPFEERAARGREGRFKFYYSTTPTIFKAEARRKADYVITDTTNISSVYFPDASFPLLGRGDVAGTNDGLLFRFNKDFTEVEVFVARGLKNCMAGMFMLFTDGELSDEMEELRKRAKPTNATDQAGEKN